MEGREIGDALSAAFATHRTYVASLVRTTSKEGFRKLLSSFEDFLKDLSIDFTALLSGNDPALLFSSSKNIPAELSRVPDIHFLEETPDTEAFAQIVSRTKLLIKLVDEVFTYTTDSELRDYLRNCRSELKRYLNLLENRYDLEMLGSF